MIDWLTFDVHGVIHRPIAAGAVVAFTPAGEIEWHSARSHALAGSASDTVQVKSRDVGADGLATSLRFSGNPSKFLQGHNLYGSDDLPALVYECAARALVHGLHSESAERSAQPDPLEQQTILHALARAIASRPRRLDTPQTESKSWKGRTLAPVATLPGQATIDQDSPHVALVRVDVTYMAALGDDHAARHWIGAAQRFATLANRTGTLQGASTVYFGKPTSERGRLKFYCKGPEFAAHPPRAIRNLADEQQSLAYRERELLQAHATGKLRAEIELRWKGLQERGLRYAADWHAHSARRAWLDFMEAFDMPQPSDTLDTSALPRRLAYALHAWRGGANLHEGLKRAAWYKLRRELRELAGVDIAQPCSDPLPPLELAPALPARAWPRNVVEMFPADDEPAPSALVAAGLYFEPRADWRIADRPAPSFPLVPQTARYCPWPRDPADHRSAA